MSRPSGHDPLCPFATRGDYYCGECVCEPVRQVRADERQRIAQSRARGSDLT